MSHSLSCFRCGASLVALSLPIARQDLCPDCGIELHVCKMCVHYDANVARQCREDDAEDVTEKERANFCEWFEPSDASFDPSRKSEADQAREALEALFAGLDEQDTN